MTTRSRVRATPLIWAAFVALIVLLLSTLGLEPDQAQAHALLERSVPAAGTVVPADQPPRGVSLWFSEPIEVAFNGVAVSSSSGRVDRLNARIAADDPRHVEVDLGDAAEGTYLVRWQVTSADNHVVRGSYWFSLGFAAAPPTSAALLGAGAPTAPPMEVVGRWLTLIAVLIVAGAPFFRLLVLRPLEAHVPGLIRAVHAASRRRRQRTWLTMACLLVAAELLWAGAQAEAVAAVPLPQALDTTVLGVVLLGSRFAVLWWARLALGLAATAVLFYEPIRQSSDSRELQRTWVAALLSLLLIVTTSLGSHAAGARVLPPLAVGMDVLHLAAAAVWLGALVQLSLLLPSVVRTPPEQRSALLRVLVPRVSTVAFTSVVVLALSGTFNAWEQVGAFEALGSTAYGQSLVLKLALVIPLLGIAAINLLIIRPRMAAGRVTANPRLPRRFQKLVLAETAVGAGVVLVVGILVSLPPPGSQNLPAPLDVTRQAGGLRVELLVDPNWVGISRYRVTLTDTDGRPPSQVRDVVLTFTMEGMNMGLTTVRATPRGEGVFETEGFYAGMPGIARVGVAVSQTDAGDQNAIFRIEVPDLNQKQFIGLRPTLGAGPLGLFGLALSMCGALAVVGVRRDVPTRLAALVTTGGLVLVLLLGGGLFIADQTLASGAPPELAGNPTPPDPASLALGQRLYVEHCVVCHGETGIGNGAAAASLLPPPADLTLHARWHADEQLFWFVTHGVAGTAMPAFSDTLKPTERWDVINYLHELASAPTATPLSALPAPSPPAATLTPSHDATPAPQGPTQPLGRIIFGPDGDKNFWVLTLPDKPERLTNFGPLDFTSSPVWSPDGRQVAFSYYQLPSANTAVPPGTDLYLMNADGTGVHMLAAHDVPGAALQTPAWAPDSSAVYVSYRLQGASLIAGADRIDVTSGARTRVMPNAGYPSLSRDGQRLAYVRLPSPDLRGETLWWSKPDGSEPHQILGLKVFDRYVNVRVAPDSQRVLFAAVGDGKRYQPPTTGGLDLLVLLGQMLDVPAAHADGSVPWDFWTINFDGSDLRRLTTLAEDLPVGAWSPDGSYVAFLGGGSFTTSQTGLGVLGGDGSGLRRLTSRAGHRGVDWAPPLPPQ